ncbi:MerR family transcriptional regulator [Paenibacillus sp. J22TS3]|uniref:MerR family transcriptional regulator n=1 Tax=Paenibacillus sp. J22TS3 TaxID=2807192 RepID=UPI001B2DEE9B|nr:MerR family transcriptional regulator [Paenibacillus sp. J22TS3]GIP21934.1 MerR family transcriptional regulator [Paenibacillus sp. J22TS3]
MNNSLTIRQVAALTGLSVHTLRYYEQIGLLTSIDRNEHGHRCFTSEDVTWIEFINRLKATGMTLTNMLEIAELKRKGDTTLTARRILLEEHYSEVQKALMELETNLHLLAEKITTYKDLENRHAFKQKLNEQPTDRSAE